MALGVISLVLLGILSGLFLILSDLAIGLWDYHWMVGVVGIVLMLLSAAASYPISRVLFFAWEEPQVAASRHCGVFVGLILILLLFGRLFDSPYQVEHYVSQTGNCSVIFGFLMKSRDGQKTIRQFVSKLSPSSQYAYYVSEEACKSVRLKVALNTSKKLCSNPEDSNSRCYADLMWKIHRTSALSSSGIYLFKDLGLRAAREDERSLESLPYRDRQFAKASLALDFLDFTLDAYHLYLNRAKPRDWIAGLHPRQMGLVPRSVVTAVRQPEEGIPKVLSLTNRRVEGGLVQLTDLWISHRFQKKAIATADQLYSQLNRKINSDLRSSNGMKKRQWKFLKSRLQYASSRLERYRNVFKRDRSARILRKRGLPI